MLDLPQALCDVEDLPAYAPALKAGSAVPHGSVEFVRAALACAGCAEPVNLSYPAALQAWLGREVRAGLRSDIERLGRPVFVKPQRTKAFTGFVLPASEARATLSAHDAEQWAVLQDLAPQTPLWFSEPVELLCEWRFYVCEGVLLGAARYDPDGADDAPAPDARVVQAAVDAFKDQAPVAYALDFAVSPAPDGTLRSILVEANDAWALGLYGRALSPSQYWRMVQLRWHQLLQTAQA